MKSPTVFVQISLISLLVYANCVMCEKTNEFYSSIAGLENLLRTEVALVAELEDYVDGMQAHIEALRGEIEAIKLEHQTAGEDIEGYLNNPVNAFRLIKRLHNDWPTFEHNVKHDATRKNFLTTVAVHRQNFSFPTSDDFIGSAVALVRLQETYQLSVAELASGILNGVKYGSPMSWQDCFLLGQHLYALQDYNHTVPWLQQSVQLLSEQSYSVESASLDFMESVLGYQLEMGDYESALDIISFILQVEPERWHLHNTKAELEQLITDGVRRGLLHETMQKPGDYHHSKEYRLYEQVCREQLQTTAAAQRALRCRYHHNNVGYRRLQPYKMEELHLQPYIVQFHDVIDEASMQVVKHLALPAMKRSQVHALDGSGDAVMSYRTSKSAGFEYNTHHAMVRMAAHIADLSGLDMHYAEELQVANYGIGGHYEPHWDCFPDDAPYEGEEWGNRLATAIYYLSDVEAGGGTAFPFLRLLVKPEKGSVLFWYNLHSSGDPDYRTKHAACPVLKGSKWISNIWIRLRNQHHVRACQLERDNEISQPFKDYD